MLLLSYPTLMKNVGNECGITMHILVFPVVINEAARLTPPSEREHLEKKNIQIQLFYGTSPLQADHGAKQSPEKI